MFTAGGRLQQLLLRRHAAKFPPADSPKDTRKFMEDVRT